MKYIRDYVLICVWIVFCVLSLYGFGYLMEDEKFDFFDFQATCSFLLILFCLASPKIVLWGLLWIWGMTFSVMIFVGLPAYFLEKWLPGIFEYYDKIPFFAKTSLVFGFFIYLGIFWGFLGGLYKICRKIPPSAPKFQ